MSEVLTRSLITGLSTVFLIGVLLIFGGDTLQDFAFAMMVGVASGTYSSIFIAAPVLTEWKEREPAYRVAPRPDRGGDGPRADLPRGQRGREDRRGRAPCVRRRGGRRRRVAGMASPRRRQRRPPRPSRSPTRRSSASPRPTPTAEESGDGAREGSAVDPERARKRAERKAQRMKQVQAPTQTREVELDGSARLVDNRGRALALHRLPPRPLLGRASSARCSAP